MNSDLVNLYNYNAGEWIKNFHDKYKLLFCWLDYDMTYNGNEANGVCPRRDIDNLFKYEMLRCPSYFAVTFSQRNNNNWTISEIIESIMSMANRSGYYLTMEFIPELDELCGANTKTWTKLFFVDYV